MGWVVKLWVEAVEACGVGFARNPTDAADTADGEVCACGRNGLCSKSDRHGGHGRWEENTK